MFAVEREQAAGVQLSLRKPTSTFVSQRALRAFTESACAEQAWRAALTECYRHGIGLAMDWARSVGLGAMSVLFLACGHSARDFATGGNSGAGGQGGSAGTSGGNVSGGESGTGAIGGGGASGSSQMGEAGAGGSSEMGEAGAGGVAPVDLCKGVVCETPPANDCNSGAEFQSYDMTGSCADGVCSYVSHRVACTCQNHACTTDPCLTVTCASPPAAACTGANGNIQTTYSANGVCSAGSCSYTPTNKTCAFGCANGACKPDPCATLKCTTPPAAVCKNATTSTSYAATGTCNAGTCSYAATDAACGTNKACSGAGVCSECKTDSSCGAACSACSASAPKCKDLGTTSKCVGCLSNADCSSATPICNTATNVCGPPSCVGLAATCGPSGNASCCASNVVTGGTFNRSNDVTYPATVSDFRLDNYEITVGRFRKFWSAYPGNKPAAGSGKNPNNPSDPGWDVTWNTSSLPASQAALTTSISCDASNQTWTVGNDALPMNCLSWYEAEAFCIWDGGRLPTEAEWNYAAAGGAQQRAYPWGSTDPDCTFANFYNSGSCVTGPSVLLDRVGSESPKGDGLYGQAGLAGNVLEWVQDWYAAPYTKPCNNCANTSAADFRVIRGGAFNSKASGLVTSSRDGSGPSVIGAEYGARCARAR